MFCELDNCRNDFFVIEKLLRTFKVQNVKKIDLILKNRHHFTKKASLVLKIGRVLANCVGKTNLKSIHKNFYCTASNYLFSSSKTPQTVKKKYLQTLKVQALIKTEVMVSKVSV